MTTKPLERTEWYATRAGTFRHPWRVAISDQDGYMALLTYEHKVLKFKTEDSAMAMALYLNSTEEQRQEIDHAVARGGFNA